MLELTTSLLFIIPLRIDPTTQARTILSVVVVVSFTWLPLRMVSFTWLPSRMDSFTWFPLSMVSFTLLSLRMVSKILPTKDPVMTISK
jgi:hypothetical protein